MCLSCCVKEDRYGDILPGIGLMRATVDYFDHMKAGQWGLVISNDPFVIFDTPIEDPYFGMTDEQIDADTTVDVNTQDTYYAGLLRFREVLVMSPYEGSTLYCAGLTAGYDPDKYEFGCWLYDRLAQYIKTATVEHT